MAITKHAQWWIRTGGNVARGGGFDAQIAGAGTNYCDQDAAQLSLTDLACTAAANTTLTSATGGFTTAMIGNCIRIDASTSGSNFIDGYFFVTARTDTNTVTIDRTCNTGSDASSGTGELGGAFATFEGSLTNGGTSGTPVVASPIVPGNTINVQGGGTDDPASADYTPSGYFTFPDGDVTDGPVAVVGYNGRPHFRSSGGALLFHNSRHWTFENVKGSAGSAANGGNGMFQGASLRNCYIDQNGFDCLGFDGDRPEDSWFHNTGSSTAGAQPAWRPERYGTDMVNCLVDGWKGYGADLKNMGGVLNSVIANCKGTSIGAVNSAGTATHHRRINGTIIYNNAGDGIRLTTSAAITSVQIGRNIITGNAGYGINCNVNTTAENDLLNKGFNWNAFYNNTSGARNAHTAGDDDITLTADPHVDAANSDYNVNTTSGGGQDLRDSNITLPST